MIEINGQKFERNYSLKTPTKQLIVAEDVEDKTNVLVTYKDNVSGRYIVVKSFYNTTSAIEFCKNINEKLKLIHRAKKVERDIPFELRIF